MQTPEKQLDVEVVSSFSLNVYKKQKLSSTKSTNEAFLEEERTMELIHFSFVYAFIIHRLGDFLHRDGAA